MKKFNQSQVSDKAGSERQAEQMSRQLVRIVLTCLRRLSRDYAEGQQYRLVLQDEETGPADEVVAVGELGSVLMALLGRLEAEGAASMGWELVYWGRRDKDGLPLCVTTGTDEQKFYLMYLAA